MEKLWTLGGLRLRELLRRTARESWRDDVFGWGGRMAFYQFLAIFPSLLVFVALSSRVPHMHNHMKDALDDLTVRVMPGQVSEMFQRTLDDLNARTHSGLALVWVTAGAAWASMNGTWAMIFGLNFAYEVKESRPWPRLGWTIAGLTATLAVAGAGTIFLIFCSARAEAHLTGGLAAVRVLEWVALFALLLFSFAVLYRFAPNRKCQEWRSSTPGALLAVMLWMVATVGARAYFNHVDNYTRSYGHLNGVVMLLLWLYLTNGAVLIGGEMNSEIAKAVEKRR